MTDKFRQAFAKDVNEGLSSSPKELSSKYFYDEKGDTLFVKIMGMPEYYLTRSELQIFREQTEALINAFGVDKDTPFDLYELGAGDGTKTMELLKGLQDFDFTYKPIDISSHAIDELEKRVATELPAISVEGMQGEYFQVLKSLSGNRPKVILFMGSNIGNMVDDIANSFLKQLSNSMNAGDKLLIGVDLKKPASVVLPAYNDKQGYTREFNLNLLDRMNKELDANFDREKFEHAPIYDEVNGWAMSFIKSLDNQKVEIGFLNKEFSFEKDENIFMEISRKYDDSTISAIAEDTDFQLIERFYDRDRFFSDVVFEKGS